MDKLLIFKSDITLSDDKLLEVAATLNHQLTETSNNVIIIPKYISFVDYIPMEKTEASVINLYNRNHELVGTVAE